MESQPSFSNAENSIGQNARSRRVTGEQQAAIRLAAEIGDDLRKNCPELAEE